MKLLITSILLLVIVTFGFSKEIGVVEDVPVFIVSEKVTISGSISVDVVESSKGEKAIQIKLYAGDNLIWNTYYRQNFRYLEIDDLLYAINKYNKGKKVILDWCEKNETVPDDLMVLLLSDDLGMAFVAMSTSPDYGLYSKKYDKGREYVIRFCILRKYSTGFDKSKIWALTDENVEEFEAILDKAISYMEDGESY